MVLKQTRNIEATKARILAAAASLLVEDGFSGFGVNALAVKAGVGKPLIYRYFDGPDGVLLALLETRARAARKKLTATRADIRDIPRDVCRLLYFGRLLAFDDVLKAFFRGLVSGEIKGNMVGLLLDLCPQADVNGRAKAAAAFLLAGASMIVLMRDVSDNFAGVSLATNNDMAAFEAVFVEIARHYFK